MDHDGRFTEQDRAGETGETAMAGSADVIPFPLARTRKSAPTVDPHLHPAVKTPTEMTRRSAAIHAIRTVDTTSLAADLIALLTHALGESPSSNGPTVLGALGGVTGFAAQQSLLLQGPAHWHQPMRAAHLDRMLVSDNPHDQSLWLGLKAAAATHGHAQLPDPKKLLAVTQKCLGTNQFGVITLPPAHRLAEQPQTGLIRLWARVRDAFDAGRVAPAHWPLVCNRAAAAVVAGDLTGVPVHVAVRIVLQAALAMALVEPRQIPGAAVRTA